MKNQLKCLALFLVSVACARASWSDAPGDNAGGVVSRTARSGTVAVADAGLLPAAQANHFASGVYEQAHLAGVKILSTSRVDSLTNTIFIEKRQHFTAQATESQLRGFLKSLGSSNSVFRVPALSLRLSQDPGLLDFSVAIVGNYRLETSGPAGGTELREAESQALSQRRNLRSAALDCYTRTRENLPPGWKLEALNFEAGKRLSLHGTGPADQVRSLMEFRTDLQKAKGSDGLDLFQPTEGQATMRMGAAPATNFTWTIELELKPMESE